MQINNFLPDMIQWHEGMLLTPQHFQQSGIRNEELVHQHLKNISPFYWGINQLKIDKALLSAGIFSVNEVTGVMPDGAIINYPDETGNELKIDLEPYLEELKRKKLKVFLAIPSKTTNKTKGALERYVSIEGNLIDDENTGDSAIRIPRLLPNLSLLVTDSPSKKYSSFPIAELSYDNALIQMTDFIAPELIVSLESPLREICHDIVKVMRAKAVFLSDKINSSKDIVGLSTTLDNREKIYSLTSSLPYLESLVFTGMISPFQLYQTLCQVAGQLTILDKKMIPPIFKPFNQNDIFDSFKQVKDYIIDLLEYGITENYNIIPFHKEAGSFKLKINSDWYHKKLVIGIRGEANAKETEISNWLNQALIASNAMINILRERRIKGINRTRIDGDEKLVPVQGTVLFELELNSEFLNPDEELCISSAFDGEITPAGISLFVRN